MGIAKPFKMGLVLVALLGVASLADAAVVGLSPTSPGPTLNVGDLGLFASADTKGVAFNDNYYFAISTGTLLAGSAVSVLIPTFSQVSNFALELFNPSNVSIFSGTSAFPGDPITFSLANVPLGIYHLNVTGTYTGSNGGTYFGNVSVVPLPAAAWLLLSGVAGLGAMARRRKVAAEA